MRQSQHHQAIPMTPYAFRKHVRSGLFTSHTTGQCEGFVQANVAILPKAYAEDFQRFCEANTKPYPLIARLPAGVYTLPKEIANAGDIRRDVPQYCVLRDGNVVETISDITPYWTDELVTFLIGCSFTFELALMEAGIRLPHVEQGKNVAIYESNIPCQSVGPFHSNMVVSMRPINQTRVHDAIDITSHYPTMHGAPVHVGDPKQIGITDLSQVTFGDAVTINPEEVPVFWACGVTPQRALMNAKMPFAIIHAPGHMLITDIPHQHFYAR